MLEQLMIIFFYRHFPFMGHLYHVIEYVTPHVIPRDDGCVIVLEYLHNDCRCGMLLVIGMFWNFGTVCIMMWYLMYITLS